MNTTCMNHGIIKAIIRFAVIVVVSLFLLLLFNLKQKRDSKENRNLGRLKARVTDLETVCPSLTLLYVCLWSFCLSVSPLSANCEMSVSQCFSLSLCACVPVCLFLSLHVSLCVE